MKNLFRGALTAAYIATNSGAAHANINPTGDIETLRSDMFGFSFLLQPTNTNRVCQEHSRFRKAYYGENGLAYAIFDYPKAPENLKCGLDGADIVHIPRIALKLATTPSIPRSTSVHARVSEVKQQLSSEVLSRAVSVLDGAPCREPELEMVEQHYSGHEKKICPP